MSRKPKIVVTRKLPAGVEKRLEAGFDALLNESDRLLPRDELLKLADGADGLLVTPTERCDAAFIDALPASIRVLATFSVGFDHIDIAAARARGLAVTNTPDVLTDATADIALLLLLGAARGASWGQDMVRNDAWPAWSPTTHLGFDVTGKRLGILGMGRIGRAVAARARSFEMHIHYHNRSRLAPGLEAGAHFHESIDDLLAVSDFLSINCALTPETQGLLNRDTLARMPRGAIVVNTARGGIIDDDALIDALNSGHIAAAGLDVFNNEPDIDPRYRTMDNVFCLPHLGSATPGTRDAMGHRAVDNLDAFFAGKTPGDLLTGDAS